MKAYPAYKDSGIEWLGEIPVGWGLQRLKWLVRKKLQYGANEAPESEDGSLPRYIRITDFGEDGKLRDDTFKSLSYEKAKDYLLTEGDILFARSGATVGKTFQFTNYKGSACFAGYLIKAAPDEKKIISDFLYAFTKSNSYENWKNGTFIQATIQNIGADKYNSLPVPLPPLPEQRAIAAYLDHKTRLIDTYVAKKQQQIERLQAYRTVLINQAVTKGLNPDAPMKESGIEWLGEIPAHWEILPIKYVAAKDRDAMVDGPFGSSVNVAEDYGDYSIPVVRTVNITDRGFNENDLKFIKEEKFELLKRHSVKPDDILFSKVGTIGNVCLFPEHLKKGMLSTTGSCKISVDQNKIKTKYMLFTLRTMKEHWYLLASSNVQPFLNMTTIKNVQIPLPTLEEQVQIVGFIETETVKIDNLITTTQQQIGRLQAYRTALISDAVTGKIDVRTDNYRDYT